MDKKMLAHVADAVENTHLEVMIRTFALFFALRFPMATILKPGKGLFRLEGIYGVLWDGLLPGTGGWRVEIDLIKGLLPLFVLWACAHAGHCSFLLL